VKLKISLSMIPFYSKLNKMKKLYLVTVVLVFFFNNLSAQEYATDKGAMILNASASFTSSGGSLYETKDKTRITSLILMPSVDYFVLPNFFLGGTIQYSGNKEDSSMGDRFALRTNSTLGIGPEIGYVCAKTESKLLPYLSTGLLWLHLRSKYSDHLTTIPNSGSGNEYFIGAGVIMPLKKHIGLTIGGIYRDQNYTNPFGNKISEKIWALKVGISGLLFKSH
jgi:hypothetical protein